MASGFFFDPVVALRVAPLVSSTCTLLYGFDQSFFLNGLNSPYTRKASKDVVRPYFQWFWSSGTPFVVSLIAASFWGGIGNLLVRRSSLEASGSFRWYTIGLVCSLSHLLFVPLVAPSIRDIVKGKEGIDYNERLSDWTRVNTIRTWTVDLFAWTAFIMAVGKSLQ